MTVRRMIGKVTPTNALAGDAPDMRATLRQFGVKPRDSRVHGENRVGEPEIA